MAPVLGLETSPDCQIAGLPGIDGGVFVKEQQEPERANVFQHCVLCGAVKNQDPTKGCVTSRAWG